MPAGAANAAEARKALLAAQKAALATNVDTAWRLLNKARRMRLKDASAEALAAHAKVLSEEASKLRPWREKAVKALLDGAPGAEQIVKAAEIVDEDYANKAYRHGLRGNHVAFLVLALLLALIALFLVPGTVWTDIGDFCRVETTTTEPAVAPPADTTTTATADCTGINATKYGEMLLVVALVGLIGAIFSSVTSVSGATAERAIPEVAWSFRTTLLRLASGPVAAVLLFFLITSAIYHQVFNVAPGGFGLLVISFVAGYSERLVQRVIGFTEDQAAKTEDS